MEKNQYEIHAKYLIPRRRHKQLVIRKKEIDFSMATSENHLHDTLV